MSETRIKIKELEMNGETAIRIAKCLKKHEPEIWKALSGELKQALRIHDVVEQSEQFYCLPAVYASIEEAINDLKLDKRVKWKVWNNKLCRYTKKSLCPEYVVKNGLPVQINCT